MSVTEENMRHGLLFNHVFFLSRHTSNIRFSVRKRNAGYDGVSSFTWFRINCGDYVIRIRIIHLRRAGPVDDRTSYMYVYFYSNNICTITKRQLWFFCHVKLKVNVEYLYGTASRSALSATQCVTYRTVVQPKPQPTPAVTDFALQPYTHTLP